VLRGVGLGTRDRRLIAAFGPRGLSSLLFALLPVFAGIAGAERIFTVTCLVVLLSVVVHGGGIALFLRRGHRRAAGARPDTTAAGRAEPAVARAAASGAPLPAAPEASAPPTAAAPPERIEIAELRELVARGEPVTIVDARAERSYGQDAIQAKGAIRLPPQDPVRAASELRLAHHGTIVVYCA
jgi:sodium/hydrogen antiporter